MNDDTAEVWRTEIKKITVIDEEHRLSRDQLREAVKIYFPESVGCSVHGPDDDWYEITVVVLERDYLS